MAKPRDELFVATRRLDLFRFMNAPEDTMAATLLGAIEEMMIEVAARMQAKGANPNPDAMPELVFTFQAKGGSHHERKR